MDKVGKLPFRVHRAKVGLTQKQIAELIGVCRSTYAGWEKYEKYPDAKQLIRLSVIFKCTLDAFYFPLDANLKLVNEKAG